MQQLGMPDGHIHIQVNGRDQGAFSTSGQDSIEFMVSANAGQPLLPLSKVASGGELSRISLAIQVVTAQYGEIPTLIFDEVDVGIGGGVAEIVGRMLRRLGTTRQVLCVTHLPQVAAQGHQHLKVQKTSNGGSVRTNLDALSGDSRVEEIARMLGGVKITDRTLAHAREMIDHAQRGE